MLTVAAVAAAFTLGLRAAGQTAQPDPAAQDQIATELFEAAQYREALGAYDLVTQDNDSALGSLSDDLVAAFQQPLLG